MPPIVTSILLCNFISSTLTYIYAGKLLPDPRGAGEPGTAGVPLPTPRRAARAPLYQSLI
jgi:hypothetical protein